MEAMADEAGVTCAVCQEGRTLMPSELLGLYAYIEKASGLCNRSFQLALAFTALCLV